MSVDARILVGVPADVMVRALTADESSSARGRAALRVSAVGPNACVVSSPFRSPFDAADAKELIDWVRAHVPPAHDDPRGVLTFPDELSMRARTYDGAVSAVGNQGLWLSREGKRTATFDGFTHPPTTFATGDPWPRGHASHLAPPRWMAPARSARPVGRAAVRAAIHSMKRTFVASTSRC